MADKRKPGDEEIDVFGLTHIGKVRSENQDHFLICSLHQYMKVHGTSLPDQDLAMSPKRLAFLGMVADGVGGNAAGEAASRLALSAVASYVSESLNCYYVNDTRHEEHFTNALHDSVRNCHDRVLMDTERNPLHKGMATTLTLVISVWPRAYVVQVGDSRTYLLRDRKLLQLTRDQTIAQDLVDAGALDPGEAEKSRWKKVLSSCIGGKGVGPVVGAFEVNWGDTILLCSDGLTKHLDDNEITAYLTKAEGAKIACEGLLEQALERGGEDNITIVVGRLPAE